MLTKGTSNRSKAKLAEEIESMGARFDARTGREKSHVKLTVLKDDIRRAITILGDAFSNTALDAAEFEVTK